MKAVVINEFGGRDKLVYREDVPMPEVKEGEILVRIKAAAVNPVDFKIREGARKNLPHSFPLILGWDMAGIVEETGFAARRYEKGDEVYGYLRRPMLGKGCYAEYIAAPESYFALKPYNLSFEEAAAVPLTGLTALQSLNKAKITTKQLVLILAASGGVGSMAVQLAKLNGARVVGLCSTKNIDYVRGLGADDVIPYDTHDWVENFVKKYRNKADVVFDCAGKETTINGYHCVKPGGTIVSITSQPNQELASSLGINALYHFVEPNVTELDLLTSYIDSGKLKVNVSTVLPLKDVAKAHELMESEHTKGKIVLTVPE
jgi:NADPH:quinone reductase-like Zn-dependent oxidoreductase